MTPLGLYVHVPFCRRRCPYCDFAIHTGANEALRARYLAALHQELRAALNAAPRPVSSVFFGGGTPTALSVEQLGATLQVIHESAPVAPDAEISLEANPEDLSREVLGGLRAAGFNRLSLGAQSLDDATLGALGRVHRASDVERVMSDARAEGWDNVSLDLIFGLPSQSAASWRNTLQRATELGPQHVSCYALTIEEGTPFARQRAQGRFSALSPDCEAELLDMARDVLGAAGIQRYEVSNSAQPGRECRHNLNYWRGGDYLACGAGAHGHQSGHRWWNERATLHYIEAIEDGGTARGGEERLSPAARLDERVMLGLRLREGIAWRAAAAALEVPGARREQIAVRVAKLEGQGVAHERAGVLKLAPERVAIADAVAAQLLS